LALLFSAAIADAQPATPSANLQHEIIEAVRSSVLHQTRTPPIQPYRVIRRRYVQPAGYANSAWDSDGMVRESGNAPVTAEFVNLLREPFEAAAQASFTWDHWGKLRGRSTYVFAYSVERSKAGQQIGRDSEYDAPAYSGLIYVDMQQRVVLRITRRAMRIPATSQLKEASAVLDYEVARVDGGQSVLPFRAEKLVRTEGRSMRTIEEIAGSPPLDQR